MRDIEARILANRKIGGHYYKMTLEAPYIAQRARPGQFVQIRCRDSWDPLLRRPFSVHRVRDIGSGLKVVEILYEVVGKGTQLLSGKKAGDYIDVLGPLGSGFVLPRVRDSRCRAILIAGGIGIAPLSFLADVLVKKKIKTSVLIGAKTKNAILCDRSFKTSGVKVYIATDDGTRGYRGFVSGLFRKIICEVWPDSHVVVYACGPYPMLKSVAEICSKKQIQCQVSVEEKMACGFGACLGCAVKVRTNGGFIYKLVCKDGPVFNAKDII